MDIIINSEITLIEDSLNVQNLRTRKQYVRSKKAVRERDKKCVRCNSSDELVVHHIFPLSSYPTLSDDEENMILLCKKCHQEFHDNYKNNPVDFVKYMMKK